MQKPKTERKDHTVTWIPLSVQCRKGPGDEIDSKASAPRQVFEIADGITRTPSETFNSSSTRGLCMKGAV